MIREDIAAIKNINDENISQELNSTDKAFFKIAGFAGMSFFFVILVFSYFAIFKANVVERTNSKVIFYIICMLILELIILTKVSRMFTLNRKKISDYITAFFLIFFQIYFLITIVTFLAILRAILY
jgi:hypothetical protein